MSAFFGRSYISEINTPIGKRYDWPRPNYYLFPIIFSKMYLIDKKSSSKILGTKQKFQEKPRGADMKSLSWTSSWHLKI